MDVRRLPATTSIFRRDKRTARRITLELEPGREKEWVLEALLSLTERICAHPRYPGDALEDVIMGSLEVVLTGSQGHNGQNFSTATQILRRGVMAYESAERGPPRQGNLLRQNCSTFQ